MLAMDELQRKRLQYAAQRLRGDDLLLLCRIADRLLIDNLTFKTRQVLALPEGETEAASALRGFNASAVRSAGEGRLMLSAAVPVQRYKQVLGALLLTRDNRAIAASLREVRYDMLTIAAAALGITVLLSLYLAGTITQPIVRLARAAASVPVTSSRARAAARASERP